MADSRKRKAELVDQVDSTKKKKASKAVVRSMYYTIRHRSVDHISDYLLTYQKKFNTSTL